MQEKKYTVEKDTKIPFHNNVAYCIGTGRMGLALQKEYQEQLAYVQEEIGFSHIRGHGLFSDDMAIYQEYTDENGIKHAEYNFTYLDLVMDSYLSLNIRPFLELGFMPDKMASGKLRCLVRTGTGDSAPSDGTLRGTGSGAMAHRGMERA